jgi:hypothetical protein
MLLFFYNLKFIFLLYDDSDNNDEDENRDESNDNE